MVGDRRDTDIGGAVAAGMPALLVLSGGSGPADLLAAPPGARPDFLGRDLAALLLPHPPVRVTGRRARCGAVTVTVTRDGAVEVTRSGDDADAGPGDGLDGLRALTGLAWTDMLEPREYDTALETLDLS
jgi:hypothetical protein